LCHAVGLLELLHRANKGHTFFSKSWVRWLAFLAASPHWVDRCCGCEGSVPTCSEWGVVQLGWQKGQGALYVVHYPMVQIVRCCTAHLTPLIFSELGQKSPFLTTDLEAHPTPLPMMSGGGDHDEHACSGSHHCDRCQPLSHRSRTDASSSQASPLARWIFTLCQHLLLCHDASLCFFIGVGLHLLHMQWPSSCMASSLPGIGSQIEGKVASPCGRTDWQPLSAPMERCSQNVMSVASEPRLSSKTSSPQARVSISRSKQLTNLNRTL
jgi:hypothetical protein